MVARSRLRRSKRSMVVMIGALIATLTPMLVVATPASALTCSTTFTGSVAQMEKYLSCAGIAYDVVTPVGLTAVPAGGALAPDIVSPPAPAAGGASCQWGYKDYVEICSQKGVGHLECVSYFSTNSYPHHCGPADEYNIAAMKGLQSKVVPLFSHRNAKACVKGVGFGAATSAAGVIFPKLSAGGGPLGVIFGLAVGCIGGIASEYFWN